MSTIAELAPQSVWKHFYALTQVPRPSGYLEPVQHFLLDFGKKIGVETFMDDAGNIIVDLNDIANRATTVKDANGDIIYYTADGKIAYDTVNGVTNPVLDADNNPTGEM
jgi:dipeptidase D